MNYRIDLTREEVISAIKSKNYPFLWDHDQLLQQRITNNTFGLRSFHEAKLNFDPTFKYNRGTNQFDSSDKQRIPAYCDRIFSRGPRIIQHSYERLDIKMSDHRPVGATFSINVKKVDDENYKIVKGDIEERFKREKLQLVEGVRVEWLMTTRDITLQEAENLLAGHGIKEASKYHR
jgi:hypothetical protein